MFNPARHTHTKATVIATVLLAACGVLIGTWVAALYDVLRVGVLDNALANRLGYIGEITGASVDPRPHGISRSALIIMFLVGLVGGLIAFATTAVSRRAVGDPEAVAYALGCGFVGAGAGFAWLATGWPVVERDQADAFGTFIHFGGVWVPLILLGIGALCLLVWWVDPDVDEQPDTDTPTEPPSGEGHASTSEDGRRAGP